MDTLKQKKIDRSNPLPYYYQLKEFIIEDIENKVLKPGERITSENELCEKFNISRSVVRQTLNELRYEGFLYKVKGKGTFVAEPKITESLAQSVVGFYEDMTSIGVNPKTKVLELSRVQCDTNIAKKLQIESREEVIKITRLRFINKQPFVLTTSYIPFKLCPGLLKVDLNNKSLYSVMEEKFNIKINHASRTLEAIAAGGSESRLLGVSDGSPLILLTSVGYNSENIPVEYFDALHRGDLSRFEVNLARVIEKK